MRTRSGNRRNATLSLALTWCALVFATPLFAQTVSDPVFGLSVTPPSGYAAMLLTPMPSRRAMIAVTRTQRENAGCLIEFEIDESNSGWTQAYFNNRANDAEWIQKIRAEVGARYDILSIDPIILAGVYGMAISGDRHYQRANNVTRTPTLTREWYVILDTMKGRTAMECTALRPEFEERQAEFAAMLRTVSVPK